MDYDCAVKFVIEFGSKISVIYGCLQDAEMGKDYTVSYTILKEINKGRKQLISNNNL